MTRTHRAPRTALLILLGAVLVAAVCSIVFGTRVVSWAEITAGLGSDPQAGGVGAIVVAERVPRTVAALLAGACLGLSGALMQALTRNPIADPGILGINAGASFAMIIGIAYLGLRSTTGYIWTALLGAAVTAVFVYVVGSIGSGGATPVKLALAGVATTAALSSLIRLVMLPRAATLDEFRFWQVGSIGRATWDSLLAMLPCVLVALVLTLWVASPLNSLALGDEMAVGLGVNIPRTRLLAAAAGVLLAAATTAVVGPIGFVGLMVPHSVRMLTGSDQRWVLPLSALGGAALLTFADVLGRVIARPSEVEVGIVTAFLGAPVLIVIARGAKVREL